MATPGTPPWPFRYDIAPIMSCANAPDTDSALSVGTGQT